MYKERERPHKQARDLTRAGLRNGRETQYSFSGQIETWFLEALDPIDYREDVWERQCLGHSAQHFTYRGTRIQNLM